MSIVGFDDLPAAGWPLIQLTTVAFDLDAMARRAASLLVDRIEEGSRRSFEHAVFESRWSAAAPSPPPPDLDRRRLGAASCGPSVHTHTLSDTTTI